MLLKEMGKLEEARPLLEEVLQAMRETLGHRHRSTLNAIVSMSVLLWEEGQKDKAVAHIEEAVQAYKETMGEDHPETKNAMAWLQRMQPACK